MKRVMGLFVGLMVSACADAPAELDEELGSAELEVLTVPTGVVCISVTATGASTVVRNLKVTPGSSSAVLKLGQLPLGNVAVNATAWNTACPTTPTAPAGTPAWIADSVSAEINLGETTRLSLRFRRYGETEGEVSFEEPAVELSAGSDTSFAILENRKLHGWGGLSGLYKPTQMMENDVLQVAGGVGFACFLLADRTVWCSGQTESGQRGANTFDHSSPPSPVVQANGTTLTGVQRIAAGAKHACAIDELAQLWCWGDNDFLQLGRAGGDVATASVVQGISGVVDVSASAANTCGLLANGRVHCWGGNFANQLGRGSNVSTSSSLPSVPVVTIATGTTAMIPLTGITLVRAIGNSTCALRADGTYFCWGTSPAGILGAGPSSSTTAVAVPQPEAVVDLDGNSDTLCVVLASGALRCVGQGATGMLGDGKATDSKTMVTPLGLADIVQVATGTEHVCALDGGGRVWCWGGNTTGQLGTGDTTSRFVPTRVLLKN